MESIILASASPRRKEILTNLRIPYRVLVSNVDESEFVKDTPAELVRHLSYAKASAIAKDLDEKAIIIAADTVVVMDGHVLGKPEDHQDAIRTLMRLSGCTHQVYTGITMIDMQKNTIFCDHCITHVHMRPFDESEAIAYVQTDEPMDKAGSYGIQGMGSSLIAGIEGDYFNVVGLPTTKLIEGFDFLGYPYFKTFHN